MFDEIYNLHLINNELDWIKEVVTLPEFRCIMYDNHLFKNIRDWIKKHNGKQLDTKVYCTDCRELFKCDSKDSYTILLSKKQAYWDSAFNQYFLTHIHPDIDLIAR